MDSQVTEVAFEEVAVVEVLAAGPSLWTLALPHIAGPVRLRITAEADHRWTRKSGPCTASGAPAREAEALCPTATVGALIGKIGGSSADVPLPSTAVAGSVPLPFTIFGVGTYCVRTITDDVSGPLFLAMNDTLDGFAQHTGQMRVTIAIAVS